VTNVLDAENSRLLLKIEGRGVQALGELLPRRCACTAAIPPRSRMPLPIQRSTYTGIQMDRHTRLKTCPDGDRGRHVLRERSPAKRT
jgi:hypothetical protein